MSRYALLLVAAAVCGCDAPPPGKDQPASADDLLRAGRYAQAARGYAAMPSAIRESHDIAFREGLALVAAGDCDAAAQRFRLAWHSVPTNRYYADALIRTGASCARAGDDAGDLALAAELFEAEPDARYGETLAMALAAAGQYDNALRTQRHVVRAQPDNEFSANLLERFRNSQAATHPWPVTSTAERLDEVSDP